MAKGLRAVINAGVWCFSVVEQAVGYSLTECGEDKIHDLSMPESADVAEAIAKRGAFEDSITVEEGVLVKTDGTIERDGVVFNVRPGKYGFLPGFRWNQYGTSRIWSMTNGAGLVVTWEGALEERQTNSVVSFQAELYKSGDMYRYSPMVGTNGVGIVRPDNELILGVATNTTSLYFAYIGDLGDGTGDYDGDGLTDYEEVMVYRTNPRLSDSDEDGLGDDDEFAIDMNPLLPDSDGDGIGDFYGTGVYSPSDPYWKEKAINGLAGDVNFILDSDFDGIPDWAKDVFGSSENSCYSP